MIDEARRAHLRQIGFQPGQSGNPAGRPQGARSRLGESFVKDYAESWSKHGKAALDKLAIADPGRYCQIVASLLPKDVALTLQARIPGNLSPEAWEIFTEIAAAIEAEIADAGSREPGKVLEFVRDAIRANGAKLIEQ